MQNYTKRQLMELLEKLPEDAMIAFVAAYDIEEGDIIYPLGQHDPNHPNADCFFISIGDPDEEDSMRRLETSVETRELLAYDDSMSGFGYSHDATSETP